MGSVDREEEMIRMKEVQQEMDMEELEVSKEEVHCAFTTTDIRAPARLLESKVQPPISPRRTRSGAILTPSSREEAMSEASSEERTSLSPRRTRNGAFDVRGPRFLICQELKLYEFENPSKS